MSFLSVWPRQRTIQINMPAITIIEPWCSALAYHGKDVENRSWRPSSTLMDQVVLLHAGKNPGDWQEFAEFDEYEPHLEPLVKLTQTHKYPPLAGLPLATARVVGFTNAPIDCDRHVFGYEAEFSAAKRSPWAMPGQCQHIFAERTPLPQEWLVPEFKMRGMLGYWTVNPDLARRLIAFHLERNPR